MNYKSFDDLSEDIKKNLYKLQEKKYDLIVGIPRSGMIPAYMIGLYLNVDIIDFDGFINNRPLQRGLIRKTKSSLLNAHDANNVLLVDDSIATGNSLKRTIENLPEALVKRITTMSVYSSKKQRSDVDLYLEYVSLPRVFEWNIFHRKLLASACVDIDGVLCLDPTEEQNDDGEKYLEFLLNAKPHIIPSYKIHSLVTSRLEKYRAQTEKWLTDHGVEYERLIMLNLKTKEERQQQGAHAIHKAQYYKDQHDLSIFIESDVKQAMQIMEYTSKPVYCVDDNFMFYPGFIRSSVGNPRHVAFTIRSRIVSKIPNRLKCLLRPLYKTVFK
jgi:uncharacterized HAD superfamily protein/adenine/guanine phosphoribosyltransferase-like PRPP-binding protein